MFPNNNNNSNNNWDHYLTLWPLKRVGTVFTIVFWQALVVPNWVPQTVLGMLTLFIQNIFRSIAISVFGQAFAVPVLGPQNGP